MFLSWLYYGKIYEVGNSLVPLVVIKEGAFGKHRVNLLLDPLLHFRVLHQVKDAPEHRASRGLNPSKEELTQRIL